MFSSSILYLVSSSRFVLHVLVLPENCSIFTLKIVTYVSMKYMLYTRTNRVNDNIEAIPTNLLEKMLDYKSHTFTLSFHLITYLVPRAAYKKSFHSFRPHNVIGIYNLDISKYIISAVSLNIL